MSNEILTQLLEEWVKELKVEIKSIHKCGATLRDEVSNLKNEVGKLQTLNKDFNDHETRIRKIEEKHSDKEIILNKIENHKELVKGQVDTLTKDTKTNSDNITWAWRSIGTLFLAVASKIIFF